MARCWRAHPELAGKGSRIELHCDHMPDARALELLNLIHDQIALQEIAMEVIVADGAGCCESGSCICRGVDRIQNSGFECLTDEAFAVSRPDKSAIRLSTSGTKPPVSGRVSRDRAETPARSETALRADCRPPSRSAWRRRPTFRPSRADRRSGQFFRRARCVDVQFHFGFAVLERVGRAFGLVGQPALLAERNKAHSEFVGDR